MIKQLTKLSKLHKTDLKQIKTLVDYASQHDGFNIKLYWYVIENRLTNEFNDFFYYLDGNLISYLGLFTFQNNEAEMTAVVHPKFRNRGLFRKMLGEAQLELNQRHIGNCVWICPRGSTITADIMRNKGGEQTLSQVEMIAARMPIVKKLPVVQLRPATKDDLPLLARIGSTSFQSSFTDTLQRFTENMTEKNRFIWLASAPGHEHIGKIHVRYDESKAAFIHDLCILPEFRGQKYATAMMLLIMDLLRSKGQRTILLDVESDNLAALQLYEQCGFDVTTVHDFWRISTNRML